MVDERRGDPGAAVRNLAAKAWRRASAVPKRAVRIGRRAGRLRDQLDAVRGEWRIERELAALGRSGRPILAGPWLSEVGFEILYWIPFLRWFEDRYRIDRERVVAISRGGVAEWYAAVATRYVEIFDHLDPATFGLRNAERRTAAEGGGQKQTTVGTLDEELLAAAKAAAGIEDAVVCHPSFMYRLFTRFWFGSRALDLPMSRTRFAAVERRANAPALAHLGLPDRYVAAKFYTGAALADTPEHRQALRELLRVVAERTPVVVLDAGMATDEHRDYLFHDLPNVISLGRRLTPQTNLGVQTCVIAGARRFIGTCGSLAWLAPMLGVDTVAIYADDRFLLSHLLFATNAYRRMGAARFDTLDLGAALRLDLASTAASVVAGRPQPVL